ncbi:MAG: hypothetical protein ACRDBO_03955 [Lachnospiraceae bacterium]
MMNQQPQESIWGTINSCVEIAINIYMIIAVDEHGVEHTGIMAHKDTEGKILSTKAAEMAEKDGDWLCFDENIKDVALYEVLQKRLEACKKIEAAVLSEMEDINRDGQVMLSQYFGECQPPISNQDNANAERICNGIYLIHDGDEVTFAVNETIANHYLTPLAMAFSQSDKGYHYFSLAHCAVAIHELKPIYEEVDNLIVSADSLYATLQGQFAEYVMQFNKLVPEQEQIPAVSAPQNLFLPIQLEQDHVISEHEETAPEEEYGEAVDYGIEP